MTVFPTFGQPVPRLAYSYGVDALVDMTGMDRESARQAVTRVVQWMERYQPDLAMHEAMKVVDLTGAYRLMATLARPYTEVDEPIVWEVKDDG